MLPSKSIGENLKMLIQQFFGLRNFENFKKAFNSEQMEFYIRGSGNN